MKHLPLILLALMAVLFFLTLDRPEAWAGWLHAFSEAGMVGALADWFAVVALFRHPMGIPIPHTAIIPRRKDEIGDSLARFVADHFLAPDVVRTRLATVNIAGNAALWLKSPRGHDRVVELFSRSLRSLVGALNEEEVRHFITRLANRQLNQANLAPLLGQTLEWLIEDGRHQQMLTRSLQFSLVLLHDNRDLIRGNVQRESPWWLPGFVDDKIVVQMLDRIETLLLEMALDPDHSLRDDFNGWVEQWADDLKNDREYRRLGEQFKTSLLENKDLQDYFYTLWQDLVEGLEQGLSDPKSPLRAELGRLVTSFADELERDADMQLWLNGWLLDSIVALVDENREAISSLISDTVRTWDAVETSERVEAAIGRDLQFIRVNGTLVGGLVGVVIHAFKLLSG
jgi:uncharacterized membrane-anchored protein YjiN (DUF445 family)